MVREILFIPADKKIIASKGKSLLQIGLSGGLKLRHNCANGSCGECRANLIDGDIRQVKHGDYCLSAQEKSSNTVLMCCYEPDWNSPNTKLVLEAVEQGQSEPIALQSMTITVNRVEEAAPDHRILFCKTPRSQALRFFAGQHVDLENRNGDSLRLSIANCPCDGRFLEFHIARSKSGFSEYIFSHLKKGSRLALKGPYGQDLFDENSLRPLVFIAYGSGFAAINSLIEHAQALDLANRQTLLRFSADGTHYRANLCRAWEDAFDRFSYVECQDSIMSGAALTLAAEELERFVPHPLPDADFYLALPREMARVMGDLLISKGVSHRFLSVVEI